MRLMLFHLVITVFEMKIILTCRITRYFIDELRFIINDGWIFSLDEDYKVVDVDEDLLDDFIRGYDRTLDFKIEADVELKQLKFSACLTVDSCLPVLEIDDIGVNMKDDAFVERYISKAEDSQIVYELDPDDNEELTEELFDILYGKIEGALHD